MMPMRFCVVTTRCWITCNRSAAKLVIVDRMNSLGTSGSSISTVPVER